MNFTSHHVLAALWIGFAVVWGIGMLTGKRVAQRASFASEASHRIFLAPAIVLALTPFFLHGPLGRHVLPDSTGLAIAGDAIAAAGLAFAIWARITIGGNWSGSVTVKEDHQLTRSGPYALVRHPIYTGILLMFLGTAISAGTVAAFLGWPLVFTSFMVKSRIEERVMREQFGEAYVHYAAQVRALVPFVW